MKRTVQGHCRYWKYTLLKAHESAVQNVFAPKENWYILVFLGNWNCSSFQVIKPSLVFQTHLAGAWQLFPTMSLHGFRGSIDDVPAIRSHCAHSFDMEASIPATCIWQLFER